MSILRDYEWFTNRFNEIKRTPILSYNNKDVLELEEFNFKIDSSDWEIEIVD